MKIKPVGKDLWTICRLFVNVGFSLLRRMHSVDPAIAMSAETFDLVPGTYQVEIDNNDNKNSSDVEKPTVTTTTTSRSKHHLCHPPSPPPSTRFCAVVAADPLVVVVKMVDDLGYLTPGGFSCDNTAHRNEYNPSHKNKQQPLPPPPPPTTNCYWWLVLSWWWWWWWWWWCLSWQSLLWRSLVPATWYAAEYVCFMLAFPRTTLGIW